MMATQEHGMQPYAYPEDIDASRALAVYRIMHNKGTAHCWTVMDLWVTQDGIQKVLHDLSRILDHNNMDAKEQAKELSWWMRQLTGIGIAPWNDSRSARKN